MATPVYFDIGDFVWLDRNANGVQDSGEPGVKDVKVYLCDKNGNPILNRQDQPTMATTDGNGFYKFTQVDNEEYTLRFVTPANTYIFTKANTNNDDTKDSDANVNTGLTPEFTINYNTNLTLDVGLYLMANTVSLGDYVWNDANKDGIQDSNEVGIQDVTVKLYYADGTYLMQAQTDKNGKYLFDELLPAKYKVEFVKPDSYLFSPENKAIERLDSDANSKTGFSHEVDLSQPKSSDMTIDAGMYLPSIGDCVWEDLNKNGLKDAGEPGIAGVKVTLYNTAREALAQTYGPSGASAYDLIPTVTTDANGFYQFTNLSVDNYRVRVNIGKTYTSSPVMGSTDADNDNDFQTDLQDKTYAASKVFSLAPGENKATIDAGLVVIKGASVGNFVWEDKNGNGQQDTGETGIANVVVHLYNSDGTQAKDANGNNLDTQTNASGAYSFKDIKPGSYYVKFDKLTGYGFTWNNIGADATDSDADRTTGQSPVFTLAEGQINNDMDAGMYKVASVGDQVWLDSNKNGIQDDTSGVADVSIEYYMKQPAINSYTGQTYWDWAYLGKNSSGWGGYYNIYNLMPGDYQLKFTLPSGSGYAGATTQGAGSDRAKDSDVNASGYAYATVASGATITDIDAGVLPIVKVSLSGVIWTDHNGKGVSGNGLQDTDKWGDSNYDKGARDVKINLFNEKNQNIASTTTDVNGKYLFSNVESGKYRIQIAEAASNGRNGILHSSYTTTLGNVGSDDTIDSDATQYVKALGVYSDWLDLNGKDGELDIGVTPLVIDLNGDGIHTISRDHSTGSFDLFGNQSPIQSGWISADDGFLAIDSNHNGKIDNIHELFGGLNKGDGFAKLANHDSNHDGVVDHNDAQFAELRIWQDLNGNHQTDAGELMTLAQAGVISVKVGFVEQPELDAQGNLHLERSSATLADGSSVNMTDVYFNVSAADANNAGLSLPTMADLLSSASSLDAVLGTPQQLVGPSVVDSSSNVAELQQLSHLYDLALAA